MRKEGAEEVNENPYHPSDPKWLIAQRIIQRKREEEILAAFLPDALRHRKRVKVLIFTTPYPPMRRIDSRLFRSSEGRDGG